MTATTLLILSCNNQKNTENQNKSEHAVTNTKNNLIGSWEDQSPSALNFTLNADGTAQSDNMATLLYQHWFLQDNKLSLVAKSVGNRNSSVDTITYTIEKLDDNELVLKRGESITNYKKVKKNNALANKGTSETSSDKSVKTIKGQLVWGGEVRTIKPCGSDKIFWVSDKTGEIKKLYSELTNGKKPYSPIFVEFEVRDIGKATEGFAAKYDGVYEVVAIEQARQPTENDCK